jgi:hypothetical protein
MSAIAISLLALLSIVFLNVMLGNASIYETYNTGADFEYATVVGVDTLTGAFAIVVGLAALSAVVGIQVFGSGISEQSVRIISLIVGWGAVWGVFSALGWNLINSIEIFGYLIWVALTILYAYGVLSKISEG